MTHTVRTIKDGHQDFGDNGNNDKFLADGEKTSIVYDVDGHITGTADTLIIAKQHTPIITDECEYNDIFNAMVCPHERDYVSTGFSGDKVFNSENVLNETDTYWGSLQRNDKFGEKPLFQVGACGNCMGSPSLLSNESYHYFWDHSKPHERIFLTSKGLKQHDWVRVSFCLQGAQFKQVKQYERAYRLDGTGFTTVREPPAERVTLQQVNSIEEGNDINDYHTYYYDGEWVHIKMVGEYDIYESGSFIDSNGNNITYDRDDTQLNRLCHRVRNYAYVCILLSFISDIWMPIYSSCE